MPTASISQAENRQDANGGRRGPDGKFSAARVADAACELLANPADDAERVQLASIARSANRTVARNMCPTAEDVPGTQTASIATATLTWPAFTRLLKR